MQCNASGPIEKQCSPYKGNGPVGPHHESTSQTQDTQLGTYPGLSAPYHQEELVNTMCNQCCGLSMHF